MQYVISRLVGCPIRASDGDLGKVDEFYFDDETWTIRCRPNGSNVWNGPIPVCILISRGNPSKTVGSSTLLKP